MQGTPVTSANLYSSNLRDGRYDSAIMRQITPPSHQSTPHVKESGSITQGGKNRRPIFRNLFKYCGQYFKTRVSFVGTPVHQRSSSLSNSSAEFYSQQNNKRSGTMPTSNFYPGRPHSFNDDQRSQIILNDYVTSQRLCNINDALQREKSSYYYPPRQGMVLTFLLFFFFLCEVSTGLRPAGLSPYTSHLNS